MSHAWPLVQQGKDESVCEWQSVETGWARVRAAAGAHERRETVHEQLGAPQLGLQLFERQPVAPPRPFGGDLGEAL